MRLTTRAAAALGIALEACSPETASRARSGQPIDVAPIEAIDSAVAIVPIFDPATAPDALHRKLELALGQQTLELELVRNDAFLARGYRSWIVDASGTVHARPAGARPPHCHYSGSVSSAGIRLGTAALSLCTVDGRDDVEGMLRLFNTLFTVAPVAGSTGYELAPLKLPRDIDPDEPAPPLRSLGQAIQPLVSEPPEQLLANEIWIANQSVNDAARLSRFGGDVDAVEFSTLRIMNMVHALIDDTLDPNVQVVLSEQVTYAVDPYGVIQTPTGVASMPLLESFRDWVSPASNTDQRQLLTGFDLDGNIVGRAYIGLLCTPNHSRSVVQSTFSDTAVALFASHELGHNLGMFHDPFPDPAPDAPNDGNDGDDICESTFIMAPGPRLSATAFSDCSQTNYASFLGSAQPGCVADEVQTWEDTPTRPRQVPAYGAHAGLLNAVALLGLACLIERSRRTSYAGARSRRVADPGHAWRNSGDASSAGASSEPARTGHGPRDSKARGKTGRARGRAVTYSLRTYPLRPLRVANCRVGSSWHGQFGPGRARPGLAARQVNKHSRTIPGCPLFFGLARTVALLLLRAASHLAQELRIDERRPFPSPLDHCLGRRRWGPPASTDTRRTR